MTYCLFIEYKVSIDPERSESAADSQTGRTAQLSRKEKGGVTPSASRAARVPPHSVAVTNSPVINLSLH